MNGIGPYLAQDLPRPGFALSGSVIGIPDQGKESGVMTLFDTTGFRLLQEGIGICCKNRDVIANNITNQDTPGYKCRYLSFGAVLRDKLNVSEGEKYTKELHLSDFTVTDKYTADQPDGNNVDYDTQQNLFVQNSLLYDALVNQMNSEFVLMRSAMRRT